MAAGAFTAEAAARALFEDGICNLNEPDIGTRVHEYEQKHFPYSTEYGLDFCKQQVVMNSVRFCEKTWCKQTNFSSSLYGLLSVYISKVKDAVSDIGLDGKQI